MVMWVCGEGQNFRQNLLNLSLNLGIVVSVDVKKERGRIGSFDEQETKSFKRITQELFCDMPYLLIVDNLETEKRMEPYEFTDKQYYIHVKEDVTDGELGNATKKNQHDFDLFVIGAGSGGVRASKFSAQYGTKDGICKLPIHPINSKVIGGVSVTCVMHGCFLLRFLSVEQPLGKKFRMQGCMVDM
ncbi:hypothetical protein L1987_20922 [Smallanthus sonchifolius]|uniref:Uncharacterized protein n=1 Tax=Smallanthus sonchifolius TaxID=185202 RepID=A0ACB9IUM3_9ASTR|nr:hypothetical protein L1987_20922 [Smallanthus sonchifolius]